MKTIVSTPNAPAAIGTYSQAVTLRGSIATTYLSGQIPLDPKTMQLVSGFDNQVKQVFENLRAVCEAAGGSLNHLVKVNVYLLDLAHFAKVNEIMATYIEAPYPARAAVAVAGLPRGSEIEIEGVMVVERDASVGG